MQADIRTLNLDQLKAFFEQHGEKAFRAKQVYEWLWQKSCTSFEAMTNLTLKTRELLTQHFVLQPVQISDFQVSKDKTIKNAFRLHDGNIVEGVLIPTPTRLTGRVQPHL